MNYKTYTAKNIQYLEGIDHIRKRPSMYIGDTNINGLHHLLYELLDNSLDEFLEGYCNKIKIIIFKNDKISIEDNGRGIPIDYNKKNKKTALELVLTKIGAGGKFDNKTYKISSGLHGVGLSCVNALSKKLNINIFRNNKIYNQIYSKGKPITKLKILGYTYKTGTRIKFTIDNKIFKYRKFNYNIIVNKLKEICFLNKGLKIYLFDKRIKKKDILYSDKGLLDYINYIDTNNKKSVIKKDIYIKDNINNIYIETILRYKYNIKEKIISFVNNIKTINGGTHITGFKRGLTKSFKKYLNYINSIKKNIDKIKGKDIRDGLIVILTIKMSNPEFEGQTKSKLVNKNITGLIEKIFKKHINKFLEENPKESKKILDKIILSYRSRFAAQKVKESIFNKKNRIYNKITGIPGKLADSTYDKPDKCEIFLVEGDSAGGTAKQGRDRKYQAILPLKGKILNVQKSVETKILTNNEIKNIFLALGVNLEKKKGKIILNINKLRYKKIIIMTDADVDGKHITSLILAFIFKYMKILIYKGYIYIARPPLYYIYNSKIKEYVWDELRKNEIINKYKNVRIQRYKGLGEMNSDQLWNTTMNPKTRKLKSIVIKNNKSSKIIFNILMGENVGPRKKFIKKYYKYAYLDI
ncbi:MAG: DNA gyrase subunit B [Candidatus Shikimatogenerans bostrichidophilus]|nr:MAG: DNA gyrase subunit B [Candidatus Shikimatogenerans bostrichidophilus]